MHTDQTTRCTKKKYFSEHGAQQHMEGIIRTAQKRDHRKSIKLTGSYKCKWCGFWHLTTQEQY